MTIKTISMKSNFMSFLLPFLSLLWPQSTLAQVDVGDVGETLRQVAIHDALFRDLHATHQELCTQVVVEKPLPGAECVEQEMCESACSSNSSLVREPLVDVMCMENGFRTICDDNNDNNNNNNNNNDDECESALCEGERVEACFEEIGSECSNHMVEQCTGDLIEEMGHEECRTRPDVVCDCPQYREACEMIEVEECDDEANNETSINENGLSLESSDASINGSNIDSRPSSRRLARQTSSCMSDCLSSSMQSCLSTHCLTTQAKSRCQIKTVREKCAITECEPLQKYSGCPGALIPSAIETCRIDPEQMKEVRCGPKSNCREEVIDVVCSGFVPIRGKRENKLFFDNFVPSPRLFNDKPLGCRKVTREICDNALIRPRSECVEVVVERRRRVCSTEIRQMCVDVENINNFGCDIRSCTREVQREVCESANEVDCFAECRKGQTEAIAKCHNFCNEQDYSDDFDNTGNIDDSNEEYYYVDDENDEFSDSFPTNEPSETADEALDTIEDSAEDISNTDNMDPVPNDEEDTLVNYDEDYTLVKNDDDYTSVNNDQDYRGPTESTASSSTEGQEISGDTDYSLATEDTDYTLGADNEGNEDEVDLEVVEVERTRSGRTFDDSENNLDENKDDRSFTIDEMSQDESELRKGCRRRKVRNCIFVQDPKLNCPTSSCRKVFSRECETRIPGCMVRRCTFFPKKKCVFNSACKKCNNKTTSKCRKVPKDICRESPCLPKCKKVFSCAQCDS